MMVVIIVAVVDEAVVAFEVDFDEVLEPLEEDEEEEDTEEVETDRVSPGEEVETEAEEKGALPPTRPPILP